MVGGGVGVAVGGARGREPITVNKGESKPAFNPSFDILQLYAASILYHAPYLPVHVLLVAIVAAQR